MKRLLLAFALVAVPLAAAPAASACAFNQCPYFAPICHGPVNARCGTSVKATACNWVNPGDPVC